jgi:catalase
MSNQNPGSTPQSGGDSSQDPKFLTNRQGHAVYDNQNQRTVGPRGPATL